ncbi:MAG: 4Fe-4S cluster-binding domain-containing protein, partial [Tenericutes bacterium]|nr:4Fe-4S cluster-binding domain-containing protein [Mycoplasmatota bacterium]
GFTFEELIKLSKTNNAYNDFLQNIDILVDGRFVLEKRNLDLLFRGSENQRLIDVKKTLESGNITLLNEYEYNEEEVFEKVPMYI